MDVLYLVTQRTSHLSSKYSLLVAESSWADAPTLERSGIIATDGVVQKLVKTRALPGGSPPVANDPLRTSFDLGQQERRGALLPSSGIRIVLRREGNAIELLSVVAREVARC